MAAEDKDLNRDPITDEPGAHPVGTGLQGVQRNHDQIKMLRDQARASA